MPRPKKMRRVCSLPVASEFLPSGALKGQVCLTVDEFEAVRLIDREGLSQEDCASYMQVARTTVQAIYNRARHKLAVALVDGLAIRIDGGDYFLCSGEEHHCACGGCHRQRKARCKE